MHFSDDFTETPTAPIPPLTMREEVAADVLRVFGTPEAFGSLEDWGAAPEHATGDEIPLGDDDIRVIVVDDDFSDEPTRPDIDVGVSRRKTEPTIVAVDWEAYK